MTIDTLFSQVKKIADACRQDASYNLFSVLEIETKEVLICRVLADLLKPRGQHRMGSVYLELYRWIPFMTMHTVPIQVSII